MFSKAKTSNQQEIKPGNPFETEGPPSSDCEDGEGDLNMTEGSVQGSTPQYTP